MKVDDEDYFLKIITRVKELVDADLDRAEDVLAILKELKRMSCSKNNFGKEISCPVCPGFTLFKEAEDARRHLQHETHKEYLADYRAEIVRK